MIRKGTIARCSSGLIGLITTDEKVLVTYPDNTKGMAWTGVRVLSELPENNGKEWSSRDPVELGHISDLLNITK